MNKGGWMGVVLLEWLSNRPYRCRLIKDYSHCIRIFLSAHSTSLLLRVKPTRSRVLGENSGTKHEITESLQIPCWVFFVPFAVWNRTKYCNQSWQEIPLTVKWMFWAGETNEGATFDTLKGSAKISKKNFLKHTKWALVFHTCFSY